MFFKKNKIKFYCELPEVKEQYPIIPASEYKFNWVKQSAKAFKDIVFQKSAYEQVTGVVKCPGVIPIMKKGFIVRAWFDLTVRPLGANQFECHMPQGIFSYLKERNFNKQLISWFSSDEPAHSIPLSANQAQVLLKITLPWSVSVPKGWELMAVPIPYPDITDFTAVHGVLEEGEFYNINAIIKINQTNREFTIFAGTPLFQFIPIKSCSPKIEINDYTDRIKQTELKHKFISNNTFVIKK
jgi:hypothetical protein